MENKPSNPKDSIGIKKVPTHVIPETVAMEVGLGMMEGDLKYGSHNYRVVGVRASVYYDATRRHLAQYWEGEDEDPDSQVGLHHISKAISSLVVMRDAMIQGKFEDDRPPASPKGWLQKLNEKAAALLKLYENKEKAKPFLEATHPSGNK